MVTQQKPEEIAAKGTGLVLLTLASAQFLMTLDSSVMNVSIATVAKDVGTTVTGIQTAITLYTLVMATLMLTGGKIGAIIGRRRAFSIGCVLYAAGSLTTALAPNLGVLILGWSFLEGIGAALIMPAVVALVAVNFAPQRRPSTYGTIAAAGAIAVALGPLIGGAFTTYASWRYVFVGEVVIVLVILVLSRRILWGLFAWERRLEEEGKEPLVRPSMFRNRQLDSGLTMFLFQYFIQAGIFFTIPLYLSIVLELSALQTGIQLIPLSLSLLVSAVGVPRLWPKASPRRVVRIGLLLLLAATVLLIALLDANATASVVTVPLLVMGLGVGALASQLGAVTVSAVPDKESSEVGGLQNTALNLGASLGTALVGSVLIAILTTLFRQGVLANPSIPDSLKADAQTTFGAGAPFVSDTTARMSLEAYGASQATIQEVLQINADARLAALRGALFVVAIVAAIALFFTRQIPTVQPGASTVVPDYAGVKDLQEQAE